MDRYILTICKSSKHITGQVCDSQGKVIAAETSKGKKFASQTKTAIAFEVGGKLAQKLLEKKIKFLRFNRKRRLGDGGRTRFHGRLAKLIEGLKKQGIKI